MLGKNINQSVHPLIHVHGNERRSKNTLWFSNSISGNHYKEWSTEMSAHLKFLGKAKMETIYEQTQAHKETWLPFFIIHVMCMSVRVCVCARVCIYAHVCGDPKLVWGLFLWLLSTLFSEAWPFWSRSSLIPTSLLSQLAPKEPNSLPLDHCWPPCLPGFYTVSEAPNPIPHT